MVCRTDFPKNTWGGCICSCQCSVAGKNKPRGLFKEFSKARDTTFQSTTVLNQLITF